jgi:hypothetical protein
MSHRVSKIFLISFILALLIIQIIPLPVSEGGFPLDKIYHFITAAILTFAFWKAGFSLTKTFFSASIVEGFGETIQIPISWRSASFYDFLVELGAIIIAVILIQSIFLRNERKVIK